MQRGVLTTARDGVTCDLTIEMLALRKQKSTNCDLTIEMLALRKQKSTNFSPIRILKESHNECYVLIVWSHLSIWSLLALN